MWVRYVAAMSALERLDRSLVHPSPLGAGARVALVSPAGPLRGVDDVALAEANARALGWEPVVGRHALARTGYFAGTDAERGGDLLAALADPTIDAIWCLRGGYGAMRLLPALDAERLRRRPRVLLGYSDITALHAAWQRAGIVSYHGPTARAELTPFSRDSLVRALSSGADPAGHAPGAMGVVPGRAEGRLVGGNLALVAALVGTPWAVSFRGAIAVLEDIHEATYRVDRMLVQLRLAGAFEGCRGIMFGHCTACPDTSEDGQRTLFELLAELGGALGVPTVMGVPVGHIPDQWTLPLGAMATLDADALTLHVHRSNP
jgi:muramoyltetrapeptide carboxypeptidase